VRLACPNQSTIPLVLAHLIDIGQPDLAVTIRNEALHGKIVSAVRIFS
jgi:hypothetical protein